MSFLHSRFARWIGWKYLLKHPKLRLWLTRRLVKDRDLTIELFGSRLCVNTIKEIGYVNAHEVAKASMVTRDELGSVLSLAVLLEPADTFVDIGANVGLYSTLVGRLRLAKGGHPYYAFEANPDTFQRLEKTLAGTATKAVCAAISDRDGYLEFSDGATSGVFAATHNDGGSQAAANLKKIECRRLDSFDISGDSLVLKIDVEGHEWQVIKGAHRFFENNRVKAVYLDGFDSEEIEPYLRGRGFLPFDGRTMVSPPTQTFSILWIRGDWIAGAKA